MSKEPYPSETADRFIVRFPDGMRDRIKEAAAANNRSMNAEIIARLEGSFSDPAGVQEEQINRIIDRTVEFLIQRGWRQPEK